MLTYEEFKQKRREFQYPSTVDRATGRTFRVLTEAAHRVSVGERIVVFCHNTWLARDTVRLFIETFGRWSFRQTAPGMVRQMNNRGFVLFRGFPDNYSDYETIIKGDAVTAIYDV